jgi:hypothetical protein
MRTGGQLHIMYDMSNGALVDVVQLLLKIGKKELAVVQNAKHCSLLRLSALWDPDVVQFC